MFNQISDNRLLHLNQQFLTSQDDNPTYNPLKGQKLCGSRLIKKLGWKPRVYLMTNDEESRFFGNAYCHSIWACPRCTPMTMAKVGENIACAIDALRRWHNELAAMFTFTIPHTKYMSCQETFQVLQLTWRMFTKAGLKEKTKDFYTKKSGTISTYHKSQGPYAKMRSNLQSKHNIRVYEFTWGENAWHPHIHALYWFPKKYFYHCVEYENDLLDRWWHCAKHCYLKVLNKNRPDKPQENQKLADELYADWRKYPKTGHRSLWISKDADGMPRVQESSYYLSGWSGDFEMTHANSKDARSQGHYSPFQMLEEAYKAKINSDKTNYDKWLKLFNEYALATKGKIRAQFSMSGINDIIRKWKQSEQYFNLVKKKFTEQETAKKPYKVLTWFNEQQWLDLCFLNRHEDYSPIADILDIAKLKKSLTHRRRLLATYLLFLGIDITQNDFDDEQSKFVETQIFENKIQKLIDEHNNKSA